MPVPSELRWLYREIWIWRAFALFVTLTLVMINAYQYLELHRHMQSVEVFQSRTNDTHVRQISWLDKQWVAINKNTQALSDLRRNIHSTCFRCHNHEKFLK